MGNLVKVMKFEDPTPLSHGKLRLCKGHGMSVAPSWLTLLLVHSKYADCALTTKNSLRGIYSPTLLAT